MINRVQAISGLVFGVFLLLHLATTVSAMGGPSAYDAALSALRNIYRPHIVVELLLIFASGGVHIACALIKIARRLRAREKAHTPMIVRVHRNAGYFLLMVITGHVVATRVMPALSDSPTATGNADYSYLAYSVQNWPLMINPYYVALGAAGATHLCLGTWLALTALGVIRSPRSRKIAAGIAATAAAIVIAGVLAIIVNANEADESRFPEFRALYEKYIPFMDGFMGL